MNDVIYLVRNRARAVSFRHWLKMWLKRIILAPALILILRKNCLFRLGGAVIGPLVILRGITLSGAKRYLMVEKESALGTCIIDLHDRVHIGSRVVVNDGVRIMTASHRLSSPSWETKSAPVIIHDYAWIATGAMILPGVTIGRGAVVGAGSVVRDDVQPFAVVSGNPARPIATRTAELNYSPVAMNAPFEAWLGRSTPHPKVH